MKRILFAAAFFLAGYWGFHAILEEGPEEELSLVETEFVAREAAVALPMPRLPERVNVAAWVGSSAEETAQRYVEMQKEAWGIQAYHELRPEVIETPLGKQFRYHVFQGDYRIVGMDIQLRVTPDQEVTDVNLQYRPVPEADLKQTFLSNDELLEVVAEKFEPTGGRTAAILYMPRNADVAPIPAVAMTVKKENGEAVQAVFRATDGQILDMTGARAEFHQ